MPYIKDKLERMFLDSLVKTFLLNDDNITGRLNYFIFKLAKDYIQIHGESYANYQKLIGELECAKAEIQRRMIAPYEDKKIKENGDVE